MHFFSHLHNVSCEMRREAGGVDVMPAFLEILPKLLLSLVEPVCQLVTEAVSVSCPE